MISGIFQDKLNAQQAWDEYDRVMQAVQFHEGCKIQRAGLEPVSAEDYELIKKILVGGIRHWEKLGVPENAKGTHDRITKYLRAMCYKVEFSHSSNYENECLWMKVDHEKIELIGRWVKDLTQEFGPITIRS